MPGIDLQQILAAAFLVEALIQTLKPVYDKEKGWNRSALFSLGAGILICLFIDVDIFRQLGFAEKIPYLGSVLTGVIVSRGSNFVHDIFKYVNGKAQADDLGGVG